MRFESSTLWSGLEYTALPEVRVRCVSAETLPECFGSEEL